MDHIDLSPSCESVALGPWQYGPDDASPNDHQHHHAGDTDVAWIVRPAERDPSKDQQCARPLPARWQLAAIEDEPARGAPMDEDSASGQWAELIVLPTGMRSGGPRATAQPQVQSQVQSQVLAVLGDAREDVFGARGPTLEESSRSSMEESSRSSMKETLHASPQAPPSSSWALLLLGVAAGIAIGATMQLGCGLVATVPSGRSVVTGGWQAQEDPADCHYIEVV